MAKKYIIRSGSSFRLDDVTVLHGGEVIELEDDVAALHADKIDPAPEDAVQTSEQAGDDALPS